VESTSTISAGLKIKGDITGTSDLTVDGETLGKIRTNGCVTVGPKGNVNDIDAREIVVYGTVHGNLNASESVRLGPSCHVEGSVLTPRISIDDGASLHGNVEMTRAGEAPEPGKAEQPKTNVHAASAHEG
jgi:cytoskeletal protein CcmA (bactofilin family)